MARYLLVSRMPDEPGLLHRVAAIIQKHGANIVRAHYDHSIDPHTVFFEVAATAGQYRALRQELVRANLLQTGLPRPGYLKCRVHLPNQPGALDAFLRHTTAARANIRSLDYDERGAHPDTLTIGLAVDDRSLTDRLLHTLKRLYKIQVLEHDTTGAHLDDTVFYLRLAESLRTALGPNAERFLFKLLNDSNHIAQELVNRGEDAHEVFERILETGQMLRTAGSGRFAADAQHLPLGRGAELHCYQLPAGGNVYRLTAPDQAVLVDTGFGLFHKQLATIVGGNRPIDRIYLTHADADHVGAAGHFTAPIFMHPAGRDIIRSANRAYGSTSQNFVLEELFTKFLCLFSQFAPPPPRRIRPFATAPRGQRGAFPIIDSFTLGHLRFEVLESFGGHQAGQVFFLSLEAGLLFTGDSWFNVDELTDQRKQFTILAKRLMTTLNVDSGKATQERQALQELAAWVKKNSPAKRCIVCGGHGPMSVLERGKLKTLGKIKRVALP